MARRWRNTETKLPEINKPVVIRATIKTIGVYRGEDEELPLGESWQQLPEATIIAKVTHWLPTDET